MKMDEKQVSANILNLETNQINDDPPKPKQQYPGFGRNFIEYIRTFTMYTGIHGIKYTIEDRRSYSERAIWIFLMCLSLWASVMLIKDTWHKWDTTPVIVSFAKAPTSVWQIPFPAVTICPQTKARQRVYNFTETYYKWLADDLDEEEVYNFSASALTCDRNLFEEENTCKIMGPDAVAHIKLVAPQLTETILSCMWSLNAQNCSNFFTEIITEDGLCFTSNMISEKELLIDNNDLYESETSSQWSLENGYSQDAKSDTYPRRVMSSGFTSSLVILLKDHVQDLDYLCKAQPQGFKIILHNPAEIPRASMRYYQAPLNEELLIIVTPDMMTTSKGLIDYDPHKRECFFAKERDLAFFQNYTQDDCIFECLTNLTLAKCGCVAYHMPRHNSTPICGPQLSQCLVDTQLYFIEEEVESGIGFTDGAQFSKAGCDCLPSCTSLVYNSEISQTDFNWRKISEGFREDFEAEYPGLQLTRLTIFFKESQFITEERNELFGLSDFIAYCGGILGLITGFSALSLVEIVYYFFLRLIYNIRTYGTHYWSGSPKLVKT